MHTKRHRRGRVLRVIALLFLILLLIYAFSNLALTRSRYDIRSEKLPAEFDGFKIVTISDLHGKRFGRDNSVLMRMIAAENPDIVLLAGDMVTYSAEDIGVFCSLAEKLGADYETYYILGNHEGQLDGETRDELVKRVTGYGVHMLDNSHAAIERDGAGIDIYGLTLPGYMYSGLDENGEMVYGPTPDWIAETLGTRPDQSRFSILLAHTPLYFPSYAQWGADLTFSGHLHGGEIRIPFVGGVFSPHGELFPEYDAGEFEIGGSTLIISRGLGEHSLPLRFLNPADMCVVTLHAGE